MHGDAPRCRPAEIQIEGSGNVGGEIDVDTLRREHRRLGRHLAAWGHPNAEFDINGSGGIEAGTSRASIPGRSCGSGDVTLEVTGTLAVEISGSTTCTTGRCDVPVRDSGSDR